MAEQSLYYILGIIGTLISIALVVNAYFIKGLLESLNQVKIQTAILIEKVQSKEKRISHLEDMNEIHTSRYHELNNMINKH